MDPKVQELLDAAAEVLPKLYPEDPDTDRLNLAIEDLRFTSATGGGA